MRRADLPRGAKVLVRLPNWLGDVVLCTPALGALAEARPDLGLTALVKPGLLEAARTLPGIGEVLAVQGTSAGAVWRQARALRGGGFAAALLFPKGFREALLAKLAGIPVRVGLNTDRRGLLLTHPVPFTREDWTRHHALQFGQVIAPLGLEVAGRPTRFPLTDADRGEARDVLAQAGLQGRPFAAFHVAASKAPRAYHPERFGQVATGLQERAGLVPVLLGAPADAPVHAALRARCPGALDLAGKTTLRGMAAVLEQAALFVGNDSGPMHLAGALGVPVAAVFGPGDPLKTAPWGGGERLRVVYAALPCSPCRQAFWAECDPAPSGKPACLEAVDPSALLRAALDLLP